MCVYIKKIFFVYIICICLKICTTPTINILSLNNGTPRFIKILNGAHLQKVYLGTDAPKYNL